MSTSQGASASTCLAGAAPAECQLDSDESNLGSVPSEFSQPEDGDIGTQYIIAEKAEEAIEAIAQLLGMRLGDEIVDLVYSLGHTIRVNKNPPPSLVYMKLNFRCLHSCY